MCVALAALDAIVSSERNFQRHRETSARSANHTTQIYMSTPIQSAYLKVGITLYLASV
jgi:hypothetical protein